MVDSEGFVAAAASEQARGGLIERSFTDTNELRRALQRCSPERWAGFQLYYPMPERKLRACTGYELVQAIVAVFMQLIPAMNCCMDVLL
ncbi:MAG: hypothetical protein ACFUZC_12330 [Chthoniobacteraceae bacterium]